MGLQKLQTFSFSGIEQKLTNFIGVHVVHGTNNLTKRLGDISFTRELNARSKKHLPIFRIVLQAVTALGIVLFANSLIGRIALIAGAVFALVKNNAEQAEGSKGSDNNPIEEAVADWKGNGDVFSFQTEAITTLAKALLYLPGLLFLRTITLAKIGYSLTNYFLKQNKPEEPGSDSDEEGEVGSRAGGGSKTNYRSAGQGDGSYAGRDYNSEWGRSAASAAGGGKSAYTGGAFNTVYGQV